MTPLTRLAALVVAAVLSTVATARADVIQITSGALAFPTQPGRISVDLAGEGFTFSGFSAPFTLWFSPYESCLVPECVPGSTLDLKTLGTGSAYGSPVVTYQGTSFTGVGSLVSTSDIYTEWIGSLVFPDGFTGGTLTAPFSFTGRFQFTDQDFNFHYVDLLGSGTATLTFGPYGPAYPGALGTQSVRFDFENPAPTPEPASLLLVATGVAAVAARRRWQRRAD